MNKKSTAKHADKPEKPAAPTTVPGYSGSRHEGKKPDAAHKGEVSSPLGVTKPTSVTTDKQK